jgi:spore maturation protein CgeB
MEFIIIGIVSAINLIVIVHKFKKGRVEDGIFDSILFTIMASLFSGSYGGMVVAMISSLIISIYLLASPPKFFRSFANRKDVKEAISKLKEKPKSRKKDKEIDFD